MKNKKNSNTQKYFLLTLFFLASIIIASNLVRADLVLDRLQFDPAIISSGDEVDVLVYFHDDMRYDDNKRLSNTDYSFRVFLEPDDSISEKYIMILDSDGDDLYGGTIMPGTQYYKKFRIKVSPQAPASSYELKLIGVWYYNGKPENFNQSVKFQIDVKRESIILNIAQVQTNPSEIRPGDDYVKISTTVENNGEKPTKSIELILDLPTGFESSYASNNRVWVGRLNPGESRIVDFYVDVSEDVDAKDFNIKYSLNYLDLDNNKYSKEIFLPILIKSRPDVEVIQSYGNSSAGSKGKLYVVVKNLGAERAESVDVRLLKQDSQPFNFDVRSDYIGQLDPKEEGIAIFDISTLSSAQIKDYDFKILIRYMGDSESGNEKVFISEDRAKFGVIESKNSLTYWIIGSIIFVILIIAVLVINKKK